MTKMNDNEKPREWATEEYYPEKISLEDFFNIIDDRKARENFIENMKYLNQLDLKYPEKWASMFCRWLELNE